MDAKTIDAIQYASENIRKYHEAHKPQEMTMQEVRTGSYVGEKYLAIPSVACYVPRGKGSFPSVLMMNAIPAVVAGVEQVVILTLPGPEGSVDAVTLGAGKSISSAYVYHCACYRPMAELTEGSHAMTQIQKNGSQAVDTYLTT